MYMTWISSSFDWAGELYNQLFADWMHVGFWIRTLLLVLIMGLFVFLGMQILQYIIGPLVVLLFANVILRPWNFLVVETLNEWIYINFYSKDKPTLSRVYLWLCDVISHNREVLSQSKYVSILHKGHVRRVSKVLGITSIVSCVLWISAFGLHQEYAVATLAVLEDYGNHLSDLPYGEEYSGAMDEYEDYYNGYAFFDTEHLPLADIVYDGGIINPTLWPTDEHIFLSLNEQGEPGARLRDNPGFAGSTVIEIVWGADRLEYLGVYFQDVDVNALYWLRVRAPSGTVGYIGSLLVEKIGNDG